MTMHDDTVGYLSNLVMEKIREGTELPEKAAYDLGGKPFIDVLRTRIKPQDRDRLLELIRDQKWWWHRYLGTNLSRPILDAEIATAVHRQFGSEPHFHTKLAYVYHMLHALRLKIEFGASVQEVGGWLAELQQDEKELLRCVDQFYSPGKPEGTWDSVSERWGKDGFKGARALYLLSFALLAEDRRAGVPPEGLAGIAESSDPVLAPLAARVQGALARLAS